MARRNGFDYGAFLKKNIIGIFILFVAGTVFYTATKNSALPEKAAIAETIPFYEAKAQTGSVPFKLSQGMDSTQGVLITQGQEGASGGEEMMQPHLTDLIGDEDIIYQPETDINMTTNQVKESLTADDIENLQNLDYLRNKFYIVDKRTQLTADDFDVDAFLNTDLTIDNSIPGPKVLVFHTHSCEEFADSDMSDPYEGIMGAGEKLCQLLRDKYGIEAIHHTGRYDIVDGQRQVLGAYERMEPDIRKILEQYPSIQVVIDMHRDGVNEDTKLVTNINGKECAQMMFFNGLCKLNKNGVLEPIQGLSNPYLKENLAMSFQMQLMANELYPTLTRKIYLNAYRYSLHMMPKSMLIEVGAQTNTREEVSNSMELLAELLASVITK